MSGRGAEGDPGRGRTVRIELVVAMSIAFVVLSATQAFGITNGVPDGERHPYVAMAYNIDDGNIGGSCSGVLVSPRVLLVSGHCTEWFLAPPPTLSADVSFAPDASDLVPQVTGTPHTYPGYCAGCGGAFGRELGNLGVIVLDEPVVLDRYAQLPSVGEAESIKGSPITIVGYGVRSGAAGCVGYRCYPGDLGVRTMTTGAAVDAGNLRDDFLKVNAPGSACYFDGGGPFLEGDGPTVLAVTSYSTSWSCTGPSYGTRIDNEAMLSWIRGWIENP